MSQVVMLTVAIGMLIVMLIEVESSIHQKFSVTNSLNVFSESDL